MEFFTEEQLLDILGTSLAFPICFGMSKEDDEEESQIHQIFTITDLGPLSIMGIPDTIELEKHNANGLITVGVYQLIDSYKADEKHFDYAPEDN